MLGLFKPRLPVDGEEFEWLLGAFAWLLREFGGDSDLRGAELILPDQRFFPVSRLTGHARAFELFEQVKAHAGMEAWPHSLDASCNDLPALRDPQRLVATFALILAQHLIETAESAPPGGRDLMRHTIELTAVFLGFGVFMANTASDGGGQRLLSQNALVAALALFVRLSGASARQAEQALGEDLRKPFRSARKAIAREYRDLRGALASADFGEWHIE